VSQDERGASSGSIRQLRPRVRLNTSREGFVTDPGAIDEAPHRLLGSLSLTAPSDMAFPPSRVGSAMTLAGCIR
jgi:hypothetical protein